MDTEFKLGDRVRINDVDNDKHGKEGTISMMGLIGCVIRITKKTGAIVEFRNLERV